MFKIAYPWAAQAEEKAEKDYLKSLEQTSQDEVAGNIWIEPAFGEMRSNTQYVRNTRLIHSSSGARRHVRLD